MLEVLRLPASCNCWYLPLEPRTSEQVCVYTAMTSIQLEDIGKESGTNKDVNGFVWFCGDTGRDAYLRICSHVLFAQSGYGMQLSQESQNAR